MSTPQNEYYLERFFFSLLSAERTPRPVGRHAREVERRSRCRLLAREDPALSKECDEGTKKKCG